MRIMAICGVGLGSSFLVQMNIEKVLKEMGISGVEVEHADVASAMPGAADVFYVSKDIAEGLHIEAPMVILNSIIDLDELREKVAKTVEDFGLK